jgi:cbb3-type cytochrome oxidase maturation protein
MQQNLWLAVIYNAIAVPVAIAGDADRGAGGVRLLGAGHTQRVARAWTREVVMNVLVYLVPMALALGLTGLAAFLWSLRTGQYDDMDGAALRVLSDDDVER